MATYTYLKTVVLQNILNIKYKVLIFSNSFFTFFEQK